MFSLHVSTTAYILILITFTYTYIYLVGGQGIASGFRDASSLAWRLALLCQPHISPSISHDNILKAWYLERKQQLEQSLATTIENGRFVTEANPIKIFLRNWSLWLMQLIPSWRHQLRLGRRKEGMIQYQHDGTMPFLPALNGGMCLSQVYCKPAGGGKNSSEILFSDDVIFNAKTKKGLFQLLVYLKDASGMAGAIAGIADLEAISKGWLKKRDVTVILESDDSYNQLDKPVAEELSVYALATGEEFAQSSLCRGRPEPQFYDPYQLGKQLKENTYTLIRPDRFVFASCSDRSDLETMVASLVSYLTTGELDA